MRTNFGVRRSRCTLQNCGIELPPIRYSHQFGESGDFRLPDHGGTALPAQPSDRRATAEQ